MVPSILHRHLKQLVHAAASLRGPKLETALWHRLEPWSVAGPSDPSELPDPGEPSGVRAPQGQGQVDDDAAEARREMTRLRALVAAGLQALARRAEQTVGPALAGARQAWDKVDHHTIVDPALAATLAGTQRTLQLAASGQGPVAAVAIEGLLALEAAGGLCALVERRLSSLIRLRVQQSDELMPGGRPFLDLGPAL